MEIGSQQGPATEGQSGAWMDGQTDGRTQAKKCRKALEVMPHFRVLQAGLGFGVILTLVCPEGLWLGVGVSWSHSVVSGAGVSVGVLCWSRGFFRVPMCTYLAKQFTPSPPALCRPL